MIPFLIIAAVLTGLALMHITRPLWQGRAARRDDQIPVALYRENLQRLEHDIAAGRVSPGQAAGLREAVGKELLEQISEADPAPVSGRHRALAGAVAAFTVLAAIFIYVTLGRPESLLPDANDTQAAATNGAPAMDEAVRGLAARLETDPGNVDDWILLGRSYASLERWPEARDAFMRAAELAPDRADVLVDQAEAMARIAGARLAGEPMQLLQRAMRMDPNNPKGIWLLGMAFYQAGQYAEAADSWERMLSLMPVDEPARAAMEKQIADARAQAGEPPSAAPLAEPVAPAPPGGKRLAVEVSLDPALRGGLSGNEILFVFARAPTGPPMPLAVQRLPLPEFPVRLTLDESMSMMPDMSLATFPEVVVGARISRSGSAQARSGDLQALSDPVTVDRDEPVRLLIQSVVK